MSEQGDELAWVQLCARCRSGAGGECHTPGCALWMNRAPDIPIQRAWACGGCGATTSRYDNGDACETCVLESFAESG